MHRHPSLALAAVLLLITLAFALPAMADATLYDNGPINGTVYAWPINFGYEVADSFTLSSASTITGFNFGTWLYPGDSVASVDYQIGTQPFEGATVTASVTDTFLYLNQYGYDIDQEVVTGLNVALSAGTYWLTLGNAVDTQGEPVYWDENDGPSQATDGAIGSIPSESFQIIGTTGTSTTNTSSTTPEPGSLVLLGSGLLSVAGVLRRKLSGRS